VRSIEVTGEEDELSNGHINETEDDDLFGKRMSENAQQDATSGGRGDEVD